MKEKLLRILLVAGCLYATACTLNRETAVPDPYVDGDEIAVTFSLSAEGQMASSRAEDAEFRRTISDGHLIDKVVYAVYVKTTTDESGFRLLKQYGDGSEGLGEGQALLPESELPNLRTTGATLTLRLMRGQEYVLAFWAQYKGCTAYDSTDLTAVTVNYEGLNNDETRDAFCQVYTFTAQVGVSEHVVLKRALAQINVGTAGWDYNNEVDFGNSYAYSKIVMTGINNTLNVLTGDVSTTGGFSGEVTYDWAVLPAYMDTTTGLPAEYPSTVYPNYPTDEMTKHEVFAEWLKNTTNDKEFLYVKLLADSPTYKEYITEKPAASDDNEVCTEVFKYLSMCYVLAPSATLGDNGGLAVDDVKFYLAEFVDEEGNGYIYTDDEKTETDEAPMIFDITFVPVQRNWRTNLLGGTHVTTTTDTSLFDPREISLWIDINPGFDDEHWHYDAGTGKTDDDKESDQWTEPKQQEPEPEE